METIGSQGDDHATWCLLNYPNFNKKHKQIVTDLSKLQDYDVDPKSIQHYSKLILQKIQSAM